jgi:hypothetical protein
MPISNADLIKKGEDVFVRIDKRDTHLRQEFSLLDIQNTKDLVEELNDLYKEIPEIDQPRTLEEVYLKELKRLSKGGASILSEEISSEIDTPDNVLEKFSVRKEDIDELADWLLNNKENVIKANLSQYEYHSKIKKSSIQTGVRQVREEAEKESLEKIAVLKKFILNNVKHLPNLEAFFDTYTIALDSFNKRSHANRTGTTAFLCTSSFVYYSNGNIHLDPVHFIELFGHEVIGHCLNFWHTDNSDLPFFLKWSFFSLTVATMESIAQYFQDRIFEYIKDNNGVEELFTKDEPFEEIYKRYKDTEILKEYDVKITRMGDWILSQTKMDEHQKQIEMLSKYSIEPKMPSDFVNFHRNDWNKATGLLLPKIVSELRYCVDVVKKIFKELPENKRNETEKLLLNGMWTPDGLKDYVRVSLLKEAC